MANTHDVTKGEFTVTYTYMTIAEFFEYLESNKNEHVVNYAKSLETEEEIEFFALDFRVTII